jgi:outer membrane phospholipase A
MKTFWFVIKLNSAAFGLSFIIVCFSTSFSAIKSAINSELSFSLAGFWQTYMQHFHSYGSNLLYFWICSFVLLGVGILVEKKIKGRKKMEADSPL